MNPLELFEKPQMLHAIVVHGPVVLGLAGVPLLVLALIFWRQAAWRWAALVFYGAATVSAWISEETGEAAREIVPPTLSSEAATLLSRHADLGERVWMVTLAVFVLVALSFVDRIRFREVMLLLATAGGIAVAAMVAGTAHMGGMLVYEHGVGTPHMHAHRPATQSPAQAESPEPAPEPTPAAAPTDAPPVAEVPQETAPPAPAPEPEPLPAPAPEPTEPAEPAMEPMEIEDATPAVETAPLAAVVDPQDEVVAAEMLVPDTSGDDPAWLKIRPIDLAEAEQVSFAEDVYPLLDEQCIWCHSEPAADSELDMSTVELMLKGGVKLGPALVPGKPDESSMIKYIRGIYQPRMPEDEPPLTEDQLHILRMWIAAGAREDN